MAVSSGDGATVADLLGRGVPIDTKGSHGKVIIALCSRERSQIHIETSH